MQNSSKSVDVIERLSAMRNLLARPECWTKDAFGRDRNGASLLGSSLRKDAVCWCLAGAHGRVGRMRAIEDLLDAVVTRDWPERYHRNGGNNVVAFNDHPDTTHADVLAVIDRAIGLAKEEAAND